MGEYLMMYEGLVLYMKEMDEEWYQRLCSVSCLIDPHAVLLKLMNRTTWPSLANFTSPR
jgi:hypothetical protein